MKYRYILIILGIIALAVTLGFYFYISKEKKVVPTQTSTADQSQTSSSASETKETSFVFAGDMMYDRGVYWKFKKDLKAIFAQLDLSIFKDTNIRFANLEGPISAVPIVDDPNSGLVFNFPPETVNVLKYLTLNGVSLANNHTLNAGQTGFANTQKVLGAAEIKFGGSQNGFDDSNVIRYDTPIPVSTICVDYLAFNNLEKIDSAIREEKNAGKFVIIFPHWGEEYQLKHVASQANAAMSFIDAGADLIIGGHPHVVEDIGFYEGKPIIYSLGNFVFDQTFSTDTQQGLFVKGSITDQYLELTFVPIKSTSMQPALMTGDDKSSMLTRILKVNDAKIELVSEDTIRITR